MDEEPVQGELFRALRQVASTKTPPTNETFIPLGGIGRLRAAEQRGLGESLSRALTLRLIAALHRCSGKE